MIKDNKIKIYRQKSPFSCFMNCFGTIKSAFDEDYNFSQEEEFRLMEESFKFDRECYEPYLIDKLSRQFEVEVFVESDYLYRRYEYLFEELESELEISHKVLSKQNFREAAENGMAIVLMDKWHIDMYTHFAHWVVLRGFEKGNFLLADSWTGREIEMPEERFMESIKSLKKRLRCSAILVEIKE